MFEGFFSAFQETARVDGVRNDALLAKVEPCAAGFTALMGARGGATFDGGLYRLHTCQGILQWTANVEAAFPEFRGRTVCFGFDWLGRHFALDKRRTEAKQMLVLLLEPGTGEALEIPATFADFHGTELVDARNDALASDFFDQWRTAGGAGPAHDQCVGYTVPLFLNGRDTVDNLELSDMDVYWSICGQLLNGASRE